jgi:hypothetical protein
MGWAIILGDFFTNSSGHPGWLVLLDKTQVANKQNQIGIQIFKLLLT